MAAPHKPPMKIGLFSALTATALLAGCAVGPDYQRPGSTLPDQYSQAEAQPAARAEAPVNPEWWTLFGDASLNALVAQALDANQDLQAAIARLEAADAYAREINSAYYPTVNLDAASSRLGTSGTTYNGQKMGGAVYNNRRAALSLSYEIDLSSANAAKLRDALAVYIGHAERMGGRKSTRAAGAAKRSAGGSVSAVREWARSNGHQVSERGRIPADIQAAYDKAHA